MNLTTPAAAVHSDPFRELFAEIDGDPVDYRSDRALMASVSPAITDLEWLEIQADTYRSMGRAGHDVARLVADAISGVAARMEAYGCWDAADFFALQRDEDQIDRLAADAADAA